MAGEADVTVLVVDDNAEQRLALSAVLGELNITLVEAASGRDALRLLLERDFAIILLDVNMPGMDGFETAALIRQRARSRHTPIIFVTAYSDDAYAMRGYSLGAVDYILAPVQPNVLRAKVAVFIDLYKKTEQVRQQREDLRRYASRLQQLSEASLAINSAQSIEDILEIVAGKAAAILDAKQVRSSALLQDGSTFVVTQLSARNAGANSLHAAKRLGHPPGQEIQQPQRFSVAQWQASPAWGNGHRELVEGVPMRGWLAMPLIGREGRTIGSLELSDKSNGDFGAEEDGILTQLAQVVAVAIENIHTREAREANRLKDEFLGVLSHELRTPLQAMLTWISILRREGIDAASTARGLEVIERSARAQSQLIADLLDISRIIHGQLTLELSQVELGRVIEQAIETLKPSASAKRIKIVRPPSSAGCPIVGDANRIQQVLWNLVSNAIKFTPEGGRVEIRLIEESERVGIQVHDSGCGIPAEFLPHVFERFRQASSGAERQHGGLGLGLAIVRHLVGLHGGTVEAGNSPGGGAVFSVMLPRADQPSEIERRLPRPDDHPSSPSPDVRLDGIRVVLVEDESDTRECLATGLRLCGAEVIAVDSAAAALAAMEVKAPDVLLSDIAMPGEDGHTLIRLIRARESERGGRLPAAALTAHARPEDRVGTLISGFDLHISKPIQPLDLATAVKQLARRPM